MASSTSHSLTAPPTPSLNDIWYDENNTHRKRWDGAAWEDMDAPGGGGAHASTHAAGAGDPLPPGVDLRGARALQEGTLAARPAAGQAGRLYRVTDDNVIYRDDGAAWGKVAVHEYPDLDARTHALGGGDHSGALANGQHGDRSAEVGTQHGMGQVSGSLTGAQHGDLSGEGAVTRHGMGHVSGTITDGQHGSRGSGLHADSHAQLHAGGHAENAADELLAENLGTGEPVAGRYPRSDGLGGLAMAQVGHGELSGVSADQHHAQLHQAAHQAGGGDAQAGNLDANARTTVRKNTGANVGTRRRLNLIEGANVTLTVADDPLDEEVDVTIAAAGAAPPAGGLVEKGYDGTDVAIVAVGDNQAALNLASTAGLAAVYYELFLKVVSAANAAIQVIFNIESPSEVLETVEIRQPATGAGDVHVVHTTVFGRDATPEVGNYHINVTTLSLGGGTVTVSQRRLVGVGA